MWYVKQLDLELKPDSQLSTGPRSNIGKGDVVCPLPTFNPTTI